jgi:hypothetical protein
LKREATQPTSQHLAIHVLSRPPTLSNAPPDEARTSAPLRYSTSGWVNYATADVGYNVLLDRNYKIGPFIGYSYFRENVNAFGCTQLQPVAEICMNGEENVLPNQTILTQDDKWQSLRIGASAVATIWDRWGINADVAYLPYAQFSGLDTHWLRDPIAYFPQDGTGRGVQAELILTYRITRKSQCWHRWTLLGLLDHERQPQLFGWL